MLIFPTLTSKPQIANYSETISVDPTLRNRAGINTQLSRAVHIGLKKFSFTYSFITSAEKTILQNFESDDVNYGARLFAWESVYEDKQYTVRFSKNIQFLQEEKEGRWNANIELIEVRPNSGKDSFIYSSGDENILPVSDHDMNLFTEQEYIDIKIANGNKVSQKSDDFTLFLFKGKGYDNNISITINLTGIESDRATTSSPIYLQIYNRRTKIWETLDYDDITAANTEFNLSGYKGENLTDYYDPNYYISMRIYQEAI